MSEPTRRQSALLIGIDRYPLIDGADLRGCVNDVRLMRTVLTQRFAVDPAHLEVLENEQASRDGILAALARLEARVGADEGVIVFYAGHGSRVRTADGWQESLVCADSGRDRHPNRDLLDTEIDAWIQRLNAKTPWVSLIFDCCHSGSVTRDDAVGVREVPADERAAPAAQAVAQEIAQTAPSETTWALPRAAVLLAACRADEKAREARDPKTRQHHGALSLSLATVLMDLPGPATWRSVTAAIAPQITADHPRQHPVLEGRVDTLIFGFAEHPPPRHVQVTAVNKTGLVLSGGAVHGITPDSRWRLSPQVTQGAPVTVTVERVDAIEAHAPPAPAAVGWLAEPEHIELAAPTLRIGGEPTPELAKLIKASPLLEQVTDAPTVQIAQDANGWIATGLDGRWAVRPRALADGTGLVTDLEKVAKFRGLLTMQYPQQDDLLRAAIRFEVQRRTADGLVPAATDHESVPCFNEGERAEFVITNGGDETVYVSLLEFGVDKAISLLLPIADHVHETPGGHALERGQTLRLAADYFQADPRFGAAVAEGLPLRLPAGFPWAAEPDEAPREGLITLRLLITCAPASFEFLTQDAARSEGGGHPLMGMHRLYATGTGSRSFLPTAPAVRAPEPYAVITRAVRVRRG